MTKWLSLSASAMILSAASLYTANVSAADYAIDKKGAHAFIQFRIKHLGYSWLYGRFNDFDGEFSWDKGKPDASKIQVNIKTESVDTNHAERDKHIRSDDFLDVSKYPKASFVSTKVVPGKDNTAKVTGDLTLHGVTKSITLDATFMGEGKDPWGGYRAGFEAYTTLKPADFGIPTDKKLGQPEMEFMLTVEGIKK